MSSEQIGNVLGFDTRQAEQAIDRLNSFLDKHNQKLDKLTKIYGEFNKSGTATDVTLKGLTKSGDAFTIVLDKQKRSWQAVKTSIESTRESLASVGNQADQTFQKISSGTQQLLKARQEAEQALEVARQNALRTQQNQQASNIFNTQTRSTLNNTPNANDAESLAFIRTSQKVLDQIQKNKFSLAEFNRVLSDFSKRGVSALVGVSSNVANAVLQYTNAFNKLGDATNKDTELSVKNAQAKQAIASTLQDFKNRFSRIPLDENQARRVQLALNDLNLAFKSGKVSINDYHAALTAVQTGSFENLTKGQRQLANELIKVQDAFQGVDQFGRKAGQNITLSWQATIRLFTVQILHQSLNQLIFAFRNATDEAIKFEIAVGEIRTISQTTGVSFERITQEVVALSKAFGTDVLDTAAAQYEAISNQVVNAGNSYRFLADAFKFGTATVASAKDSVNLLSSVMNSYKLNANDAERISAVLFKTIELGRVRASEMADTFGRVGTLAHSLGVTLEETSAAVATLTIQGVRYSEAYTLINNLLLKLIKPENEFKDLLREHGFASGEAAVSTLGFAGVLKILDTEAEKGTTRLGALLDEMRAIRSAVGLTGEAFKNYEKNLEDISGSEAVSQFKQAFKEVAETDGKKLQVELNKLKVFLTGELTPALNSVALKILQMVGGSVNAFKEIGYAAIFLGTSLVGSRVSISLFNSALLQSIVSGSAFTVTTATGTRALGGMAVAANIARGALSALWGPTGIGILLGGIALFAASSQAAAEELKTRQVRIFEELRESRDNYLKNQEAQLREESRVEAESFNFRFKALQTYVSEVIKANDEIARKLKDEGAILTETTKDTFTKLVDSAKSLADDYKTQAKEIESAIRSIESAIKSLNKEILERPFQNQLKIAESPAEKIKLLEDRFKELQQSAQNAFAASNFQEGVDKLKEAQDIGQQLFDLTKQQRDRASKDNAKAIQEEAKARQKAVQDEIDRVNRSISDSARVGNRGNFAASRLAFDQKKLQDLLVQQRRLNDASRDAADSDRLRNDLGQKLLEIEFQLETLEKARLTRLETELKLQRESLELIEKKKEAQANATKDFQESGKKLLEFDIRKDNGFTFQKPSGTIDTERTIAEFDKLADKARAAAVQSLNPQEAAAFAAQISQIRRNMIDQIASYERSVNADTLQQEVNSFRTKFEKERKAIEDGLIEANRKVKEGTDLLKGPLSVITDTLSNKARLQIISSPEQFKELEKALNLIESLKSQKLELLSPSDISSLLDAIKSLEKFGLNLEGIDKRTLIRGPGNRDGQFAQTSLKISLDNFKALKDSFTKIQSTISDVSGSANSIDILTKKQEEFRDIQSSVNEILDITSIRFGETSDAARSATNSIGGYRDMIEDLRLKLGNVAALEQQINQARQNLQQNVPIAPRNYFGGRFFAFGGRGLDTIPAYIRPGEFIIQPGPARKFHSQLAAINAGQNPKFFNGGGNTTVGDINVTVNGGDSSEATVNAIGQGIRREIRARRLKF